MFIITKEWLLSNKTPRGSWNKKQLKSIGVNWPPERGWQGKVSGKSITDLKRKEFESSSTLNNRARFDLSWCVNQIVSNYSKLTSSQKNQLREVSN